MLELKNTVETITDVDSSPAQPGERVMLDFPNQLQQYKQADAVVRKHSELLKLVAMGWKFLDEGILALERIRDAKLYKKDKKEKFNSFDSYCRVRIGVCGDYIRKLIDHWHYTEGRPGLRALGERGTRPLREQRYSPDEAEVVVARINATPAEHLPVDELRRTIRRKVKEQLNNQRLGNLPEPKPFRVCPKDFDIRFCDSLTLLASLKDGSIDLGFTDPDWRSQDDINQFIALASKKMKLLAVMAGNQNYLQTLDAMRIHFPYVREIAYLLPGAGNRLDPDTMNISTGFKPILVGSFNLKRGFYNVVSSEKAEHDLHPWGLNISAVQRVIEYLSDSGDLVADGYCGAGSSGIACVRSGRRFIGCDSGLVHKLVKGADPKLTWADVAIARVNEELEMQLKKVA